MRTVAACLVAVLVVAIYDDVAHRGRYRAAAGQMVGQMMHVTWLR